MVGNSERWINNSLKGANVLKLTTTILFSILVMNGYCIEENLTHMSSDMTEDRGAFKYELDPSGRQIEKLLTEAYSKEKVIDRVEFNLNKMKGPNGFIINKTKNMVILRVYSHNFDPSRGGILYFDTLQNALGNVRKEYEFEIQMRQVESQFKPVVVYQNQVIDEMRFIAKKHKTYGVVGIDRIIFIPKK